MRSRSIRCSCACSTTPKGMRTRTCPFHRATCVNATRWARRSSDGHNAHQASAPCTATARFWVGAWLVRAGWHCACPATPRSNCTPTVGSQFAAAPRTSAPAPTPYLRRCCTRKPEFRSIESMSYWVTAHCPTAPCPAVPWLPAQCLMPLPQAPPPQRIDCCNWPQRRKVRRSRMPRQKRSPFLQAASTRRTRRLAAESLLLKFCNSHG